MRQPYQTCLVVAVLAAQLLGLYVLMRLVAVIETLTTVLSLR